MSRDVGHGVRHANTAQRLLCVVHLAIGALPTNVLSATPTEPQIMARKAWDALLTHCGESYFYAGSALDGMPGLKLPSTGYNPMRWLDPSSEDFIDDATVVAEAICPIESQRDPHFDQGAQDTVIVGEDGIIRLG